MVLQLKQNLKSVKRIEDALSATRAAVEEELPGGGTAYQCPTRFDRLEAKDDEAVGINIVKSPEEP